MASAEFIDELQEWVARYAEERLGIILREVNGFNNCFGNDYWADFIRRKIGCLENARWECIKLMEPERFKDNPRSNILLWLDCMERYLTTGQIAEEEKILVT